MRNTQDLALSVFALSLLTAAFLMSGCDPNQLPDSNPEQDKPEQPAEPSGTTRHERLDRINFAVGPIGFSA